MTRRIKGGWTKERLAGLKNGLCLAGSQGCWPDEESFQLAQGVQNGWTVELVILLKTVASRFVLFTTYDGSAKELQGCWHIPGGYSRKGELSVQETCSAVAKRELGVDVLAGGILGTHVWTPEEHPYATPLSLFVAVRPLAGIEETPTRKFFPLDELPENLLPPHRKFIEANLK